MAEAGVHASGPLRDRVRRASWNPLIVSGTALPENVLLAAKLVALAFLLTRQLPRLPYHFLPFLSGLGHLGSPHAFHLTLELVFVVATALLLVNRQVRTMCIMLAAVFLVGILSSRIYFHNNHLFAGLFFLLAGLYDPRVGVLLFRYQLAVLYLGAAFNKVILGDWRTGAFVQDWLPHYTSAYLHVARLLPDTLLSAILGWIAILTEFALVVLLLIRRLVPLAVFVGVAYHTGLVLITRSTFGMFWYALMGTYLTLLTWPRSEVFVSYRPDKAATRWVIQLLRQIDFEQRFRWQPSGSGELEARVGPRVFRGSEALVRLLLYSPPLYMAYIVIITRLPHGEILIAGVVFPLLAIVAWGGIRLKLTESHGTARVTRPMS
jgi:hypothetical protein